MSSSISARGTLLITVLLLLLLLLLLPLFSVERGRAADEEREDPPIAGVFRNFGWAGGSDGCVGGIAAVFVTFRASVAG